MHANGTTENGVVLPVKPSWQELVDDKVTAGWYQDKTQRTVWLKLEPVYISATILTS